MSDPNQPSTPAGWYPDGRGGQRWWDGARWTDHVQPAAAPAAPAARPAGSEGPFDPNQTVVAPSPGSPAPGSPAPGGPAPGGPAPAGSPPGTPPWQAPYAGTGGGGAAGGGGKGRLIGAVAALVLLVVVGLVVLLTVVLGGSGPAATVEEYLRAQVDGEPAEVCELTSQASQDAAFEAYEVDDCAAFASAIQDQEGYDDFVGLLEDVDADIEIGTVDEGEESATVDYSEDLSYTGDDQELFTEVFGEEERDFTEEGTITLVKEEGEWKVDEDESTTD